MVREQAGRATNMHHHIDLCVPPMGQTQRERMDSELQKAPSNTNFHWMYLHPFQRSLTCIPSDFQEVKTTHSLIHCYTRTCENLNILWWVSLCLITECTGKLQILQLTSLLFKLVYCWKQEGKKNTLEAQTLYDNTLPWHPLPPPHPTPLPLKQHHDMHKVSTTFNASCTLQIYWYKEMELL